MKKVSIFVDVQNIYYTTKQEFNLNFDYNKFWESYSNPHQRERFYDVQNIYYTTKQEFNLNFDYNKQLINVILSKYNFKTY